MAICDKRRFPVSADGTLIEALGVDEEFSGEGRVGRTTACGRMVQSGSGLPWAQAIERDARLETDPEARLYRKGQGQEAKLCFMGNGLMENGHGLYLLDTCPTETPSG